MIPGVEDMRVVHILEATDLDDPVERKALARILDDLGCVFDVSIDPGCSSSGVALWWHGVLIRAWNVYGGRRCGASAMAALVASGLAPYTLQRVFIEVPRKVFKKKGRSRGRVKPESIIMLAWCAGLIAGRLVENGVELVGVAPREWKRGIPKPPTTDRPYVVEHRVRAVLSKKETPRMILPMHRGKVSVKRSYEVTDAVGIGLYGLERVHAGLRPRRDTPYITPEHHT